jgi:hypothetical protein
MLTVFFSLLDISIMWSCSFYFIFILFFIFRGEHEPVHFIIKIITSLLGQGMMMHACNPSYKGGRGRRIRV